MFITIPDINLNDYPTGGPPNLSNKISTRMINNIVFSSDIYIISTKETGIRTKTISLKNLSIIEKYYPWIVNNIYKNYLQNIL